MNELNNYPTSHRFISRVTSRPDAPIPPTPRSHFSNAASSQLRLGHRPPKPEQTIGHNYGYGRIAGRFKQTTQFSTTRVLSRSLSMCQLKAAFRGVAKHQQQTL
ncbi:hypothetical protein M378DRAFT_173357 [Amanita muscaria Koide BX008]|uniref:Uncharacterized protein n=1 Tax=Amanita muscaria (strain Koide BX008) TaxID=946122 RepID=A0A0C2W3T6_AMAMK|nr:hypothetical protein M378DRAFT_173357 [Amanita muscaria Koide BX008]